MRILGLRFKNLNSLTGEWHLDFTHPAYATDGLFAITGPTGAGKTTILDAVCLGLYGRTPRLDKVTRSSNEIMSRRSGECFAEVTFETQKGRYRCHWSQHRARRRPEGELQQPRHEIADADTGSVLESRIAQVVSAVETATGMDFARFTRSMLLAQGGFAAFLQAPPDERAPILEQITGTTIYSQISMEVHRRRAAERDRLDLLEAELKGIAVLDPEEETALWTDLEARQSRETELATHLDALRGAAHWLDRLAALEREIAELDRKLLENRQRQEAFAPDAKKLEAARKALGLEGDYRAVAALRALQAGETGEIHHAVALLTEKQKAAAQTLTLQQASQARLAEARALQQAEGEVIKKVRDLDTRLGELQRQAEAKERAIGDADRQARACRRRIADLERATKEALADRQAVRDYLAKHSADAALAASVAVIGRGFSAIRDLEDRRERVGQTLVEAGRIKESAREALHRSGVAHRTGRGEIEAAQRALEGLRGEIGTLLQDRDIAQWRRQADALRDREGLLAGLADILAGMERSRGTLEDLKKRLDGLESARESLQSVMESSADRKARLDQQCSDLEEALSLMSRIGSLEEERRQLEDGKPCPLCGATDHPYAEGALPEPGEAKTALKKARAALRTASEQEAKLQGEQARITAEIDHAQKELSVREAELEAGEKACAEALPRLQMDAAPPERTRKVRDALAAVQAEIVRTAGVLAAAEEKTGLEREAHRALEGLRTRFDSAGKALQEAGQRLERAGYEEVRLMDEHKALEEEARKVRAAALGDAAPFGVGELPLAGLDGLLAALTARRDAWQAKQEEQGTHEKKCDELNSEIGKTAALLDRLELDLRERRQDRDDLAVQAESLRVSRRGLFGQRMADIEERRLAEAVAQAEKALEQARASHGEIEKAIAALKEKTLSLKSKTAQRAAVLTREEQNLAGRIDKAGFADEAHFLASTLGEAERDRLAGRENCLIREVTELGARRTDRWNALEAERRSALTALPRETLQERIEAADAALKQMRIEIGGLSRSLEENRRTKGRRQDRITLRDAQRRECARWDALHALIGSADGKKFRNFAQGLTFDMMTRHANSQLEKMTDRYLLLRNPAEPLELNVIDSYQAGEIRSTKNLSGGESFIVSLALALGLSRMASRNVRIDSLFLDEGFGTLDEDALETALETLASLQQDGKLIGVISHVAALKERIAAQIQVIPETGGRSRITGPGCRRLS
ncbi:MAG: AAA family ATPase [Thermodesulfobacteriota bacterium]